MKRLHRLLSAVAPSPADAIFAAALLGLGAGCWLAWPPLGLIVPCGVVVGCMGWVRLRGR